MDIDRNEQAYSLHQASYIESLPQQYDMTDAYGIDTPIDTCNTGNHKGRQRQACGPENIQSLCKSLGEKVRAKPPQNHTDELLLAITPPPMGKTTRRELSPIEKGMIIAFFWFFRKISIVSLTTGCPWSTVKKLPSAGYRTVILRTSLDLGDPKNSPNANSSISGGRLSIIESLLESNYVMSVHLMCH